MQKAIDNYVKNNCCIKNTPIARSVSEFFSKMKVRDDITSKVTFDRYVTIRDTIWIDEINFETKDRLSRMKGCKSPHRVN